MSGCVASHDRYLAFRDLRDLGKQRDQRLVGFALFRDARHPDAQMPFTGGILLRRINPVRAAIGRQPYCKPDVIGKRPNEIQSTSP